MSNRKVLTEDAKPVFLRDWVKLTYPQLEDKYGVGNKKLIRWAKELNAPFPKPAHIEPVGKDKKSLDPVVVKGKIQKPWTRWEDNAKVKELMAEFKQVGLDRTIPEKDKVEKLNALVNMILVEMLSSTEYMAELGDAIAGFKRLGLYEKQVTQKDKESEQLSEVQLKALKKRFIQEAFDDVESLLTETQAWMFKRLIQIATDKGLAERKQQMERQITLDTGAEDAEVVH